METLNGDQSAQAMVWKFISGFADSFVVRCAVELRLADIIHSHGRPISLSDLSSFLTLPSVDLDRLYRIMRYLVQMDLFTKETLDGEERYGLSPAAKYLVTGWDKSIVPALLFITDKDMMAPHYYIKESLRLGEPTAFERALGKSIWEYMGEHPEKNKLFNSAMACDSRLLNSALVSECPDVFAGIGSLIDVGGGTGTAARAISQAFPEIKCTVFDLPHVIADSPDYPEVTRVQGDMFKSIPSADAILLKGILHDWDDEESLTILKKCKEAVPRGGKVIIVDIVLDTEPDRPQTHLKQCMDLDMLMNTGGKERTEAEWKKLIYDAGFKGYEIKHISAIQSVIEAYPN
ncbi:(RS)-norcoclaurine 6-O-methyltransferase-like isoform X1 [Aristolochia californica]|uniref:(RS)-norcoclaurine 6-O-methyltransferase-like isoform X1 n=2 Tax=Aristolochia californica TaxID=171875 RepID=UPI0035DB4DC9